MTVRHWKGSNPVRIVLDPSLKLNGDLKLFDGSVPTLCYNHLKSEHGSNIEFIKAPEEGLVHYLLNDLYQRNILSLLVEGGGMLLTSLISAGHWDEARVFTSSTEFGDGIKAPTISTQHTEERIISGDRLKLYYHPNPSY